MITFVILTRNNPKYLRKCLQHLEAQLIVVGITSILAMQTFVNIYMTIGMAPVTGIPLPFISYGGSSLLTSFLGIGVIVSIKGSE